MKIFLSFICLFLFVNLYAKANSKFIGQLDCKRSDVDFTWELKIDEEKQEVFIKHSDGIVYQYNFDSSSDKFYFSRYWVARKIRHEFIIDRISTEFESLTTYDDVSKQIKYIGTCKKKERAF